MTPLFWIMTPFFKGKWLVITQHNGWSLTHFYFGSDPETPGRPSWRSFVRVLLPSHTHSHEALVRANRQPPKKRQLSLVSPTGSPKKKTHPYGCGSKDQTLVNVNMDLRASVPWCFDLIHKHIYKTPGGKINPANSSPPGKAPNLAFG